jgi:hypothetical protein
VSVGYTHGGWWPERPHTWIAEVGAERPACPKVTHSKTVSMPNEAPSPFNIQQMDGFTDDMSYFCTNGKPPPPKTPQTEAVTCG